jgi:UDP-N-acetyl-2-amino-2-deoxyglucuronate dehydrogenase
VIAIGLVGGGNISDTHARAAVSIPGVEIAAVYGANSEKATRLAAAHRAPAYHDLDSFLAHRPMDLVAIGSPSGLHGEQAVAAARRGLHVLIEKPIDITTARVDALIAATDAAGVKAGVFFQDRLKPDIVALKAAIDEGQLGALVMASGRVKWYRPREYYERSRWRGTWALDGGGALMNQGIHTVDLLLWLFGRVTRVRGATATRLHRIEAEDTAAAVLEFESGALGVIEAATSIYPGYARRVEVTGSEGTMVLEDDRLAQIDLRTKDHELTPSSFASGSSTSPVVADASHHRRVFEDFIRAIETNGTPACDAREGRRSVAVVEAIYASARTGEAVVPSVGPT